LWANQQEIQHLAKTSQLHHCEFLRPIRVSNWQIDDGLEEKADQIGSSLFLGCFKTYNGTLHGRPGARCSSHRKICGLGETALPEEAISSQTFDLGLLDLRLPAQ
jgi:hypothetical protein